MKNKLLISVCGSAGGKLTEDSLRKARVIGKTLAEAGVVVIAPGTKGYCVEAGKAARKAGGICIGISPAESRREHLDYYQRSLEAWDFVIYSGMGYKGRNVISIQSSDAVIFIGGGTGTLNEFTIAYDYGRPIGVLEGIPGTMELVDEVVKKTYKPSPVLVKENDPVKLVRRMIEEAEDYVKNTSTQICISEK